MHIQTESNIDTYIEANMFALAQNSSHQKLYKTARIITIVAVCLLFFLTIVLAWAGKYGQSIGIFILGVLFSQMPRIQYLIMKSSFKSMYQKSIKTLANNNNNRINNTTFSELSINEHGLTYKADIITLNIPISDLTNITNTQLFFFLNIKHQYFIAVEKRKLEDSDSFSKELLSYTQPHNISYIVDSQWNGNPYRKYKAFKK